MPKLSSSAFFGLPLRFYIVGVVCCAVMTMTAATRAGLPETVARIKPAIVGVGTYQELRSPPAQLRGTGFAVGDGRYVVTNAHVLPDKLATQRVEYLAVFVGKGKNVSRRKAKKVALDYDHDLALLRIEGAALPALKLGDSKRVREGATYAFTGFPIGAVLGLYPATHVGIVAAISPIAIPMHHGSQLNRKMIKRLGKPYNVFQLDATAYPGNSGSPLYDPGTGDVVGVVNMVFVKETKESVLQKPSGISYAIPATYVHKLLKRAK